MIEFLNQAALWGGALIAVPIIIHLITRRRALRKRFAAMRFVLLSHQHLKRRLRLKRILILLARIAAVAILAMLVAHPTIPAGRNAMQIGGAPRSLVVLLDNSGSMTAEIDGTAPWKTAKEIAASIAGSIGSGQEIALLLTNPSGAGQQASFTANPADLQAAVAALKPSFIRSPMSDSLLASNGLLETAHNDLRQILLITDLQRAPWNESGGVRSANTQLVVVHVGGKLLYPPNAAISNVALNPSAGEAGYSANVEVASFGDKPMQGKELEMRVGTDTRARGFIDLPAVGRTQKKLSFSAEGKGILRGTAHLSPDSMSIDNDRYFSARAGGRIRALVVDGDPKAERYGAESYYMMNALNPKLEARSRVEPTLITSMGLSKATFGDFDLVIMANVGVIDTATLARLKQYISEGGALLMALGNNIDQQNFGVSYGDLAPAGLYILKEVPTPTHIDSAEIAHPAMLIFKTPEGGDISLPSFSAYFMLDMTAANAAETHTLLKFQDGAPAIVEKSYGRGKVALLTSTLDRDWNDLCIYPTYLPLLQQLSLYLTGGMADPAGSDYVVGQTAKFSCSGDSEAAWVFGPEDKPRKVELSKEERWSVGNFVLDEGPGFYEVFCAKGGRMSGKPERGPDRLVAANIDSSESDLERWKRESLESYLKTIGFKDAVVIDDMGKLADTEGFKAARRDGMRLMLAVLLGVLLFEGFLIRRG